MDSLFALLLGATMFSTLLVLVVGVVSFAINGDFYKRNANKLMRLRVLFQGLALAFLGILLFIIIGK